MLRAARLDADRSGRAPALDLTSSEGGNIDMAQRVAAIFQSRDAAERAADALADLGADRGHISVIARGEDGQASATAAGHGEGNHMVEPAREVGDSGAALTTSEHGDTAKGAAIGAVAGLAAGLLALTVPGIGLVLAAGPLAMAIAGGAIAGGVYGSLRDIGIEEHHARAYESRIRGGHVLLTALVPDLDQQRVRDVLDNYDAEDITFAEDRSTSGIAAPAMTAPATAAPAMTAPMAATETKTARSAAMDTRTIPTPGEIRVPVTEETAQVRKTEREVGEVGVRKEVDVETQHISQPVTQTRVVTERHAVPAGQAYAADADATVLREGETLRVPVVKEELIVEKVPRVVEEVVVRTEAQTQQVERDVQLRHERVEVDEEGEAEVENLDTTAPGRPIR